jgi:formylglycine-generating enzyme required for sulfatase activity
MGPLVLALALAADPVTLDQLLNRAAWYLDYFIDQFENVVAQEDYMQDSNSPLPTFLPFAPVGGRGGGGTLPSATAANEAARTRHRDLRSDFLLVKSPETLDLLPFRDVIQVDGVVVRDREQRLARLFLKPTADTIAHAQEIAEEGARYNIGSIRTTLGNPVFGISVLQLTYQPRFRFTLGKEDRSVGPNVWTVDYQEISSPAMIHGEAGRDLFAHGRVWIEAQTGRVLKTELQVEQPTVRAKVTTTFRLDERFDIAVPNEMREVYTLANGNNIKTIAAYGRFRRFDVTSDEDIKLPTRTVADSATGMTFVELPAGRFTMGSADGEADRQPDETLHDVEITRPFLLSRYETTQQEWRAVMGANPSHFSDCGPRCPVENVTYFEVEQFIEKLNEREAAAPKANNGLRLRYRLPSEAEWEYACRAGTTAAYSTGELLTPAQANYKGKSPVAVGSFPLNPWGLADMHGNVWEWTSDWYGPYSEGPAANIDPHGAASGEKRVIRGGSWYFDADSARCGLRYTHNPKDKGFSLGFRLAADRVR